MARAIYSMSGPLIPHGGLNKGRRVCVVGGGIGGLTAALAFARMGAVVEVHEQAPDIKPVGAGIQITPNGARVLDCLGLGAALDKVGIVADAVAPMDALSGHAIARFDLSARAGPPYRFLHRADLIEVLVQACADAGVEVRLGSKVAATDLAADIVVGADGVHSSTRHLLNGRREPFFTGQVAWRAIVDAAEADPVAQVWMAPNRHIVTYPLRGGRLNVVAVQERDDWAADGWDHLDDPDNLRAAFGDVAPALMEVLERVETTNLWGLFRRPVADVWGRNGLCLLGDAAHPTLPFLAQGANLAIEDAYVLARCCSDAGDIAAGLAGYQGLRKPRVTRAIAAANANARNYHLSGVRRRVAHMGLKTLAKVAPNAFLNRLSWLYDHDLTGETRA